MATGDRVWIRQSINDEGFIERVEPRHGVLTRASRRQQQVLVANVDQVVFVLSLVINLGMWLERYVIIVVSLTKDFLPSSWGNYTGTFWDWSTYLGTIGLFFTLLFLFVRFLPMISIFEMRTLLPAAEVHREPTEPPEVQA